ncbi:Asp-tRNA(Asn)/Glu-tRNA(Gln) amidotransferase subunit GatB [Gracilinema caldarium]|uniref:Aspartyl/glutamyl-tRNA(Asn/Gln) amidotransferase subunit B n=1 Tax=Gracilinema caldarium (strain ATCC 51460 / DSM 7334 / H1) TaxID=744872 RepID=F8F2M4_GRAC1|nr:Asp-tRNA(Asn)/Glu-tRNA(Gln) amidotransferase subunit GatB [Gracilinema caldarium]AEJ19139.1 Aspartyl/glutamyl-tRNA(Asn/Gln) amidotransferase subunit B [Gracilinema caldarium DSM 7334]
MYQSFIGLEIHIHLLTKTKVFCSCKAAFGSEPNTNVCPVCLGHPGVLPALNRDAFDKGALVAQALHCRIPDRTWFERKQYFYPDMPKNYQISQFASPLGQGGYIDILFKGQKKRVRIKECHLEEDAGKMIHAGNVTLLDYNRAGTALLEIVTEPDMETGAEAEAFIQQLRRLVRYLGVCDGNMEEGSLRSDANVSVNLKGAGLGRKVEIKNLNSSRFVRLALDYEIDRQRGILEAGGTVKQETRLWNENRDQTEPMRSKEDSHDYRFFPEPDLPVLEITDTYRQEIKARLMELPLDRLERLVHQYGLPLEQAEYICEERALADYFEAAVQAIEGLEREEAARRIALWLAADVKRIMNRDGIAPESMHRWSFRPERLAQIVELLGRGSISGKIAKQVLELSIAEDRDPLAIVQERGWQIIQDPEVIHRYVKAVCEKEAGSFQEALSALEHGNQKRYETLTVYLVGKVLAESQGRCDPILVKEHLEKAIGEATSCVC